MNAVENTGGIAEEPAWDMLLSDVLEQQAAAGHWRRITTEMRERDTLAPSNAHAVQRLVLAYVVYDRCSREVAENGHVTKPKRGNPKAIMRLSPHFQAMREMGVDAERIEAELGISPRRRSSVTKVQKRTERKTASANYLKPVAQ
ncbi:P27 family phage terminase small subunit [Novosphingopyxis sp. YJ-S2-01]|uniref:P27 family phage terminase small subunit n=1 Tax=Novosphingopyxis sp. YJ-S2-01 TaxID=2794021 RepID=UPI0018DB96A9|nr:P27 family phage terminase small subunit [Novosphingopyxis sp. YJ-S2-01]MBH9537516.1 P27 family phage terminase small subunit [Novosphingopyxis sp. YJ-S2-01]